MCNYFRQFSIKHAEYVEPLRSLLKKDSRWIWTSEHSTAYRELKDNFRRTVELSHYRIDQTFYLQADASDKGISGILFQIDENNDHQIISLVSRGLMQAEINYTTTEKELLAIVYSMLKFRIYLLRRPFIIITDHQALTFINRTPYHTARLYRWILLIQEFSFAVKYCTGRDNVVADFFSRNPNGKFEEENSERIIISVLLLADVDEQEGLNKDGLVMVTQLEIDPMFTKELKKLGQLQNQDHALMEFVEQRKNEQDPNVQKYSEIWFYKAAPSEQWRIMVPAS